MRATVRSAAVPCSALELCGCTRCALRATQARHGAQVHQQHFRRALLSGVDGLDAADHFLGEGAVRTRLSHRVLRRCYAVDEYDVAQSSSSELATQRHPSQPYSRLMMAMYVGGRLADSG